MMQYVHCLRIINNQSTAICRQIIRLDIEVEYFYDNIIFHHPTSVWLVMQNSRREPHSSVTVRRLRDVGGKLNFFGK